MQSLLIRLRPETYQMLKAYCKRNRRTMTSYIDELIVKDLKELHEEAERLEQAQRNAGSIT